MILTKPNNGNSVDDVYSDIHHVRKAKVELNSVIVFVESNIQLKKASSKLSNQICNNSPTSSTDIERLFTTAGDIFIKGRNRLQPENEEQWVPYYENLPLLKYER